MRAGSDGRTTSSRGNLRYREDEPGTFFRNYQIGLHGLSENNWGGVRRFTRGYVHSRATWTNFWEGILEVGYVPPWTSDVATRGGPLMEFWSAWDLYAELRNNRQAKTRWEADLFYYNHGSGFNTSGYYLNGMIATEPGARWRVSVEPHYSHRNEPRQFLANLDNGGAATFGRRTSSPMSSAAS